MPGKAKSKHDRCAEKVKAKNPNIDNPHAVCVAAGVRPASWKKSDKEPRELIKFGPLGQWMLGTMGGSAMRGMMNKVDDKDEGYIGFDRLKRKLAHKKGVTDPAALAAAIGRKKYGKQKFQQMAAKGKKLKKAEDMDENKSSKHLKALEALQGKLKELKQKSLGGTKADVETDIEKLKSKIAELQYKTKLQKDDKPHPPGSPEDEAHDVVELDRSLREEMAELTPEEKSEMLRHLRTLKDKRKWRSAKNRLAGYESNES